MLLNGFAKCEMRNGISKVVAFDSNVFIYILERNPIFFDAARLALLPVLEGKEEAIVSVLVLTELLAGNPGIDVSILDHPNITVCDVTKEIARQAGKLRFTYPIKAPDAIHMATALHSGATRFITNDKALLKSRVGITMVPLVTFAK